MLIGIDRAGPADQRADRRGPGDPDRRAPAGLRPADGDRRSSPTRCSAASGPVFFFVVVVTTALILVLAANTAFNGFPVLGSILAQDRYLPRQLHTRGDRLAFSNGIVFLAAFAIVLIVALPGRGHPADPALHRRRVRLVHAVARPGMVRHWNRLLRTETRPGARRHGCSAPGPSTASALVHDRRRADHRAGHQVPARRLDRDRRDGGDLRGDGGDPPALRPGGRRAGPDRRATACCPSATTPIVLVSKVHLPTLRALAYAQATRPDTLTALTVNVDDADTEALQAEWERARGPGAADRRSTRRTGRSPGRSSTTSSGCARTEPARRGHRVHPRVRGRPLVGAPAAQPERAAAQGPAAVRAGRDGDQRAVAAGVQPERVEARRPETAARLDAAAVPRSARRGEPATAAAPESPSTRRPPDVTIQRRAATPELGPTAASTSTVGAVAHGGHCVARARGAGGVRPARAARRAGARGGDRGRARASCGPTRSRCSRRRRTGCAPPCPYAGPDGCGGCDFQHVDPAAQRELKAAVVREQLTRRAGRRCRAGTRSRSEAELPGRARWAGVPGSSTRWTRPAGPGCWPTARTRWCRSTDCRIAHPAIQAAPVLGRRLAAGTTVEVVARPAAT